MPVVVTSENFLLGERPTLRIISSALKGRLLVVGIVGKDRTGDVLRSILDEKGVGSCIFDDQRPTIVKTRVIAHNQQVVRFDREDKRKVAGKTFEAIIDLIKSAVRDHDAVIISDYKKGIVSSELVAEVVKASRAKNKFIAVDPKTGHFHYYKNVSLITPNIMEASHGADIEIKDEKSLIKAGRILLKNFHARQR